MSEGADGVSPVAVRLKPHIVSVLGFVAKRIKEIGLVDYVALSLLLLGFVNNKVLLIFFLS